MLTTVELGCYARLSDLLVSFTVLIIRDVFTSSNLSSLVSQLLHPRQIKQTVASPLSETEVF